MFLRSNITVNMRNFQFSILFYKSRYRGRRGSDRMVVGFTATNAINAYHHYHLRCCEFESRSGRGGFLRVLQFPSPIKLTATI
jgi:hypothetical protein